jgi:peptidoglycan/LPS O-acetylase OafA/YrhL
MSILGLSVLIFGVTNIQNNLSFPGIWAIIPVLGTILIIKSGSRSWINEKLLTNPVVIWFGLISYPLYLRHWPILTFIRIIEGDNPTLLIRTFTLTFSIFLAWLTYYFIEKNSQRKLKNMDINFSFFEYIML